MAEPRGGGVQLAPLAQPVSASGLLRLSDDSLCVSTDVAVSCGFIRALKRGFEPYGCQAQLAKTRTLPAYAPCPKTPSRMVGGTCGSVEAQDSASASIRDGHGRRFFNWCGLLLNVHSCEVQPDLRRRGGAQTLSSSTRLPARLRVSRLASRMRTAAKNKLFPIFVDPQLNSGLTVRRTVLHALAYAMTLGLACARWVLARKQPAIALRAVTDLIRYTSSMTRRYQRRCISAPSHMDGGMGFPSMLLEHLEVQWLGWAALAMVLPTSCIGVGRVAASKRKRLECVGASLLPPEALLLLEEAANVRGLTVGCVKASF